MTTAPIQATPATAQAMINSAVGFPSTTIELLPGQYPMLRFTGTNVVLIRFQPGATCGGLSFEGGENPCANKQIEEPRIEGGGPTYCGISIVDDVSNILIRRPYVGPGYHRAYGIERADRRWPQPRGITIDRLHAEGMVGIGGIVGASDSVTFHNTTLHCKSCLGGNGAYHHDRQATNLRLTGYFDVYGANGVPACGIRGGGAYIENAYVCGCGVNFATGHNTQTIKKLVSVNATLAELGIGGFGPLYIESAELTNNLPAAQLAGGGPDHHLLKIGTERQKQVQDMIDATTDSAVRAALLQIMEPLSRVEIRDLTMRTTAPDSGTNINISAAPEYGGVIEVTGSTQARPGPDLEWGADVQAAWTRLGAGA